MRRNTSFFPFFLVAVLICVAAPWVWAGLGSVLYEDPSTMRSLPKKTSAGFIATADGGVVNVMASPAPTAAYQALRVTTLGIGTNPSIAGFIDYTDPRYVYYAGSGPASPAGRVPHKATSPC